MKKFSFSIKDKKYEAEITDAQDNIVNLNLNGTSYIVTLDKAVQPERPQVKRTPIVQEVAKPVNIPTGSTGAAYNLKSPLPGTILDILCKVGDNVSVGQNVLLLEAMKMENNVETDKAGVVKEIKVSKGSAVMEGDVLLVIG